MKKLLIPLVILIAIVAGYYLLTGTKPATAPAPLGEAPSAPTGKAVTVNYENNAFNPAEVKIKTGDAVLFVNKHVSPIRISSNPHPVHTSYPKLESGSIVPGGSYRFVATEPASINYHNHFNPGVSGQIIVE